MKVASCVAIKAGFVLWVMAVLGGAIQPPVQGWIADHSNIQLSFIVPFIAYACVAIYRAMGHRIGRSNSASA